MRYIAFMAKKRGLPKGRTNNPHGRPPSVRAIEQIAVRLDKETLAALDRLTGVWNVERTAAVRRSIREAAERVTRA